MNRRQRIEAALAEKGFCWGAYATIGDVVISPDDDMFGFRLNRLEGEFLGQVNRLAKAVEKAIKLSSGDLVKVDHVSFEELEKAYRAGRVSKGALGLCAIGHPKECELLRLMRGAA